MLNNSVPGIRTRKEQAALTALRLLAAAAAIWLVTEIYGLHSLQKIGEDFIIYWPSGRLLLAGQDPYSLDGLFSLQKCVNPSLDAASPFYNPPWALPFILPFSLQDYSFSRLMWISFHAGVLLLCTGWLWTMYFMPSSKCPRSHTRVFQGPLMWTAFVAVSYVPVFTTIMKGQIISLVLLGVTAFLHFEKRGQYVVAGLSTVLIAIKPHILYLFWIALLLWVLDRRRWSVAMGAGALLSIATAIPMLYEPDIIGRYYDMLTGHSPALLWYTPSTGTYLRLLLGMERYWLQFVPTGLGLLWVGIYWRKHRRTWVWSRQIHLLIIVSLMTTFYEWLNDYVLLLPVITQTAAWVVSHRNMENLHWALWAYLLINVLIWAVYIVTAAINPQDPWKYVNLPWVVPSFLLVYLLARARVPQAVSTPQ
jgi:hypothetical protein